MTRTLASLRRASASLLAACALVVSSAGCDGPGAADASSKGGLVGTPAPSFSAESVTGSGPTSLDEAKGKVVILDFWATFCGPCKKSFPKYQEIANQFGGDVAVIAVSVDEPENASADQLKDFAKETGVKFSILWDKDHTAAAKYKPPTMPSSFIIDKSGVVRHVHAGYKAGEEVAITDEIKAILSN
jgi:peroxiredoxin